MNSYGQSLFSDIRSRELSGLKVRKRPFIEDLVETGAYAIELRERIWQPPLAVSFCKTSNYAHILAVSSACGFVNLFDTRKKIPKSTSFRQNSEKARISVWEAHKDSVFDVCWIKEDQQILTASQDQYVKLWDVQKEKCIRILMEHERSVRSLSCHPTNTNLIVSGARDGTFALWDLRCKSIRLIGHEAPSMRPTAVVEVAHPHISTLRSSRFGKIPAMGITSILYLKDEVSIATAATSQSIVKFWDTRNLKKAITQTCPSPQLSQKIRSQGISSLSQDLNGVFLSASCKDNKIYLYNVLQLDKGPIKSFSRARFIINSSCVKAEISPDAAYILSGCTDGNAYIWHVDNPQEDPIKIAPCSRELSQNWFIKPNYGEEPVVNWSQTEVGKIATSSTDCSVRVWEVKSNEHPRIKPASSTKEE